MDQAFDIDFGDAPAWAALAISVWVWFSSRRWQKKNSGIAARAAKATEESAEATKISADAAVRSANTAEQATALAELASQPPPPLTGSGTGAVLERQSRSSLSPGMATAPSPGKPGTVYLR
jgi:hypothetical protein